MVTYNAGQWVDSRTRAMLLEVEGRSGCPIVVTQGSYSDGENSAGTHSGGGAADIRTWNQSSPAAIDHLVLWLRRVGFAAWYRTSSQGPWGPHIHAIAIGCPDLSSAARVQVTAYYAGRNGLASNGPDDGPRLDPIPTWDTYTSGQPLPDTGDDMVKFIGNSRLAKWFETRVARALVGNDQLADWFETRAAQAVRRVLDEQSNDLAKSVWSYTNEEVTDRDAYGVLIDTRKAVE